MVTAEPRAKDRRIQAAIDNWAPRFVANGVDLNDFRRITDGLESWNDWCRTWSEWGAYHAGLGEDAERSGNYRSAGEHYFRAAMMYHFGKFLWFLDRDEQRAAHENVVHLYRKAMPYFEVPGERVEISYEAGASIPGILRKPPHIARPPIVFLIPGLDSVKEELHSYADDLLRRGVATLSIDGPGQGEMEWDFPMRYDYEVPIRYVIDWLEGRRDVDAARVGLLGVSLGGYYAARAAAFEPRLSAAVVLATGYKLADHFDGKPVLTREGFVNRLHVTDEQAAREKLVKFDLHGLMDKVQCPVLVIMGRQDRLFPAQEAEEMASDSGGRAELLMIEDGNHVCNNVIYKYRPQQADWLARHLTKS